MREENVREKEEREEREKKKEKFFNLKCSGAFMTFSCCQIGEIRLVNKKIVTANGACEMLETYWDILKIDVKSKRCI